MPDNEDSLLTIVSNLLVNLRGCALLVAHGQVAVWAEEGVAGHVHRGVARQAQRGGGRVGARH